MKLALIANGSTKRQRLIRRWGVSYLLGEDVLFDTFGDPNVFLGSIARLKIDISKIKHIVISHDHWDHVTGLWSFLAKNKGVTVYICPGFSKEIKKKLVATGATIVEVNTARKIWGGIYTTGPLRGIYDNKEIEEQAIVVKTKQGLVLLTGCAHPGIANIINEVITSSGQPVFWVIGGFHLKNVSREEIKALP